MGQRHQAFVIALIRAHGSDRATYRCIAALHHQWCYGCLPLNATARFLDLVKNENNARIIKAEINAIQGKYGRWKEAPKLPDVPCPYAALLLATSWTTDLETSYTSGVTFANDILEADMGSGDGGKSTCRLSCPLTQI